METNEGMLDRTLRVILGLAILAFPLGVFGIDHAYAWGWLGVLPLLTGLWGFCPAYKVFGISTRAS